MYAVCEHLLAMKLIHKARLDGNECANREQINVRYKILPKSESYFSIIICMAQPGTHIYIYIYIRMRRWALNRAVSYQVGKYIHNMQTQNMMQCE